MDRHIKIIATLGPGTATKEAVKDLVLSGARIFRLNFSHGEREFFENLVGIVREVEQETKYTLTILQDLSGPKVRTADVGRGTLDISKGDIVTLATSAECELVPDGEDAICLDIPELMEIIQEGDSVALSDGMLRFTATERVNEHRIKMQAINSGMAPPRKGIAFPGKTTPLKAFTEKDKADLRIGMELGVDCCAMSYVQQASDIVELRDEMNKLGRVIPIIAKLERTAAIDDLDNILKVVDACMVARGDLGLEMELAELPATQKRIIEKCNKAGRPVIVATQMLLSMVNSPMATRAETTDVANAILDGADAVMLSEETAIGRYPFDAVRFMRKIAYDIEKYMYEQRTAEHMASQQEHPSTFLAYSAAMLADKIDAKAIVTHSTSGATARLLASCRPSQSVYCLSPDPVVRRFMNLSYGVIPAEPDEAIDGHQERVEVFVKKSEDFEIDDQVVITAGHPIKGQTQTQTNVVKLFVK